LSLKKIVKPEMNINGYIFSHEERCNGCIIAILPYRIIQEKIQFLIRHEITPCWTLDYELSSITGGFEGGNPRDTAVLELKEEAGYTVNKKQLISLGISYASKSSDTIYYLYSIDLTHAEQGEATTDGSELEKNASCIWVDKKDLISIKDPQVSVMFLRLQNKIILSHDHYKKFFV